MSDIREQVKEYYSKVTKENAGKMETKICSCAAENLPRHLKEIRAMIPDEIVQRFYGCGSPIPPALEGCTVLDLGCGTGLDVYILSRLVGESGRVIGVDMNEDQLAIARKYQDEMAKKFGYKRSNVEFLQGYIEDLASLGIKDASVDVVVSNCVINLSPCKQSVFSEIWRVLKRGGELYFSDIFADRRVPEEISNDPVLRGECLGGAMYVEDFRRLMSKVGWSDFRYVSTAKATIDNEEIEDLIENINFTSRTVRAIKIPDLMEDICEQYGQFATYKGGMVGAKFYFDLDDHHRFFKDLPMSVCGNTCAMVEVTRFGKYFEIHGDRSKHFGPFDCSGGSSGADGGACEGGSCCC
ncbi:methyltransferase domain-containing protein [Campylobacter curvus]|uniref:methyltransferase domain-containing protein n=1 Tax=Campylobacter curvus TaxID=200 RepID=UPI00036F12B0|nr:methyltransferase domain-containing protein [Campylobacter curvus]QKF62126.1 methyltransferase [Campylobacter curvus]UEB50413.1 methyltransferase domain-containing protein [Campylobacter curvus]